MTHRDGNSITDSTSILSLCSSDSEIQAPASNHFNCCYFISLHNSEKLTCFCESALSEMKQWGTFWDVWI